MLVVDVLPRTVLFFSVILAISNVNGASRPSIIRTGIEGPFGLLTVPPHERRSVSNPFKVHEK